MSETENHAFPHADAEVFGAARDWLRRLAGERRVSPLTLDASATRRIGAQGLQVLLSAARSWRVDGLPLALINLGDEALGQMRAMGIDPDQEFAGETNP